MIGCEQTSSDNADFQGKGVRRSAEKAFKWYSRAASLNHAEAQNNVSVLYFEGDGVEKDLVKSAKYCKLACKQGHVEALFNMGFKYDEGVGLEKNKTKVRDVFLKI